jgi:predicted nuclease of predicted toxin-antitoxin system
LHGKPAKLLLVKAGNLRLRDLLKLFEDHLPEIVAALERNSLVEIDRVRVTVHK